MANNKLRLNGYFGRIIGSILILVFFSSCSTMMNVNAVDPEGREIDQATVSVDGLNEDRTYQIGDTGPAGGIVFFDRGFFQDGWRYLEAAPIGADFSAQWAANRQDVPGGTSTALGSGRRNTQNIVNQLNQRRESQRAAQLCANLEINGFKDWFLPSIDELNYLYQNRQFVEGLQNARYWSSSQHSRRSALALDFGGGLFGSDFGRGRPSDHNKSDTYRVRAVRAF